MLAICKGRSILHNIQVIHVPNLWIQQDGEVVNFWKNPEKPKDFATISLLELKSEKLWRRGEIDRS